MDELACLMDWDLEAIVRGCSSEAPAAASTIMGDPYPNNFSHFFSDEQDDILWSFPELSETSKVLDELEELYKPFYPVLHPLSSQTILTSSLPILKEPQDQFKVLKAPEKVTLQDFKVPAATVSKCKRSKKNRNKNVVKQVKAADGLCDSWAWRKYGQKPIKGSPYPRSYYKCSSSKGCLARKQVERSHLDPEVFLVTYTSDHSHPHPTRRNSLAGSTRRNKNNNNNNSMVASSSSSPPTTSSSSSVAMVLSPRTPLVKSIIEDDTTSVLVQQCNKGLKKEFDFYDLLDEDEGADQLGDDGWFSSTKLEELIGDLASNLH